MSLPGFPKTKFHIQPLSSLASTPATLIKLGNIMNKQHTSRLLLQNA